MEPDHQPHGSADQLQAARSESSQRKQTATLKAKGDATFLESIKMIFGVFWHLFYEKLQEVPDTPSDPTHHHHHVHVAHDSTLLFAVHTDQKTSGLNQKCVWTYILSMSSFSSRAPGRSLLLPRTKTWRHTGGTYITEYNSCQSLCSRCKPEGNFLFVTQQRVASLNVYIGFKHQWHHKNTSEDAPGAEQRIQT